MSHTFEGQSRENAYSSVFQAAGSVLLTKVLSQRDPARITARGLVLQEQSQRTESSLLVLFRTQARGRGLSPPAQGALGRLPEGPLLRLGAALCALSEPSARPERGRRGTGLGGVWENPGTNAVPRGCRRPQ